MMRNEAVCFKCGTPYETRDRVGRRTVCHRCDADLRCCRNCRHYSPNAHNECHESQAEWVRDKERANFCDYFEPDRGCGAAPARAAQNTAWGATKSGGAKEDARANFESLFRK